MAQTGSRLVAISIILLLFLAAGAGLIAASAAEPVAVGAGAPPLSPAQLKKLNDTVADKGKVVLAAKTVTDALGLTKDMETISAPALTVKERDNGLIHQFQPLPQGAGYIIGNIGPTTMEVYWADKDLTLHAAMTSVHNMLTNSLPNEALASTVPVEQAQPDFAKELAYWASVADAL
jgi:hypothetical protein